MTADLSSFLHNGFQTLEAPRPFRSPFDGSDIAWVQDAGPLQVVQSLAPAKKALEAADALTLADRAVWLESLASALSRKEADFALQEALFEGFPAAFVLEKSIRPVVRLLERTAAELRASKEDGLSHRTGLIAVVVGGPLAFRSIGERLVPALAAGNAVLVKAPSSSPVVARLWGELLQKSPVPQGLVQIFVGARDVASLLVSHPSVHGVSFAGRPETLRALLPSTVASLKKTQFSGGVKNGSLIQADADFAKLPRILEGSLIGAGRLGWGLSRVFVTESRAEEFFSAARAYLETLEPLRGPDGDSPWTPLTPGQAERLSSQLRQAGDEKAKVIRRDGGTGPVLLRDLTNCSTLQLEELDSPLLIVNTVKYAHEMAKWTNTGDYGFCASVWGGDEAARRLAAKLNVARVWINGWMEGEGAFAGWRKSFFGNPDFHWRGSFYSDVKTLT